MRQRWDGSRDPLAALAAGQPALFEEFVTKEAGTLLGFFRRLGAAPGEDEDLVQETILKLFRSASKYQPNGRFEAYAFRAARNAWIDGRRRAAVRERGDGQSGDDRLPAIEQAPSRELEPFESLATEERARLLQAAILRLDDSHRGAFELGVIQGLPYSEVADLLGVPIGTIKSRVHHATKKLREDLGSGGKND